MYEYARVRVPVTTRGWEWELLTEEDVIVMHKTPAKRENEHVVARITVTTTKKTRQVMMQNFVNIVKDVI